jgi:hypothetical protein
MSPLLAVPGVVEQADRNREPVRALAISSEAWWDNDFFMEWVFRLEL